MKKQLVIKKEGVKKVEQRNNEISCDLVIIGSGPAGMTAAVYAARAGLDTKILESTMPGGAILNTSEIDNFPGFVRVSGAELARNMQAQVESCGVETVYDEISNISLSDDTKTIVCADTTFKAKSIIIATGAGPRKIGCPNEEKFIGRGVHFCGLCDGAFYRGKDIVVVGGGNSALEEAVYLSPIAANVVIINNMPRFGGFTSLIEKVSALANVRILHNTTVEEILGGEKLVGIKTNAGEEISCAGVFVAIGRTPNTDFLRGTVELSNGGYVKIGKRQETGIAGVYAAGDVCEKNVRQIVTACADGAVAATHAAEYVKERANSIHNEKV